jgi:hypothetical protein
LEKLGFPWILSSESSLINGLRGIFAGEDFARPFSVATGRRGPGGPVHAGGLSVSEGRIVHKRKLKLISAFAQQNVAEPNLP